MSKPLVLLSILLPGFALLTLTGAPRDARDTRAAAGTFARRGRMPSPDRSVPRAWVPPVKSERWECIVIHHSATPFGGAARFDRAHRERGFDELGYHFVIGNGTDTADGQVEVGPRWRAQKYGAHCRSPEDYYNEHGIGICLVGNFDESQPTTAQAQSLAKLVKYLSRTYDIPASHVYTHGGITGMTHCPGKNFDLKALRKAVK
jgi:N-acetyl-anhydromuramyl-L-alanine amidase AmpD